jgi:hypothetical protein
MRNMRVPAAPHVVWAMSCSVVAMDRVIGRWQRDRLSVRAIAHGSVRSLVCDWQAETRRMGRHIERATRCGPCALGTRSPGKQGQQAHGSSPRLRAAGPRLSSLMGACLPPVPCPAWDGHIFLPGGWHGSSAAASLPGTPVEPLGSAKVKAARTTARVLRLSHAVDPLSCEVMVVCSSCDSGEAQRWRRFRLSAWAEVSLRGVAALLGGVGSGLQVFNCGRLIQPTVPHSP